jgi:hypothetical protein
MSAQSAKVVTDDRGGYLVSDLQQGIYRVTITAVWFGTLVEQAVAVDGMASHCSLDYGGEPAPDSHGSGDDAADGRLDCDVVFFAAIGLGMRFQRCELVLPLVILALLAAVLPYRGESEDQSVYPFDALFAVVQPCGLGFAGLDRPRVAQKSAGRWGGISSRIFSIISHCRCYCDWHLC